METNYRTFLLRLSENITEEKLEQLKYLCMGEIPEGSLETINSPLQLFKDLERRQMIGIDNLSFLRQLLTDVMCLQLASRVDDFISRREVELFCLERQRQRLSCSRDPKDSRLECVAMSGGRRDHSSGHREALLATGGREVDQEMPGLHKRCSCLVHCPPNQRRPGEIYLRLALELAAKGTWVAGTAFILKRYIKDPVTLAGLFASVVLPSGILIKYLYEGSIICVLEANNLHGLKELWQNYKSGKLQKALEEILITEELKMLAEGQDIILSVALDENMYREVCLELMVVKEKVDQTFERVKQRPRSLSDPKLNQCEKPENTQQESLHIVANTERKRRLHVENKLEKLQSGQSVELNFPELQLFTGKKSQDTYGDDNSSMTSSTSDEEDVLDWEDKNINYSELWLSIKGGLKEKTWDNFEKAVRKTCPELVNSGGTPLLKFLAYVLKVNYANRESSSVSRHDFIRLSKWFGSPTEGLHGCLQKMIHLMKNSVSVDSDGKRAISWFAGYMTEQEAKEKLQNKRAGAFLVRFNRQSGFLLTKKSRDGHSIVDFPIEVLENTGEITFNDRVFQDLPSLVKELQTSWMTDLQPFYSMKGFGTESSPEES